MTRHQVVELTCDRKPCTTTPIRGRTWDEAAEDAEDAGWLIDDDHFCPTHRPADPEES